MGTTVKLASGSGAVTLNPYHPYLLRESFSTASHLDALLQMNELALEGNHLWSYHLVTSLAVIILCHTSCHNPSQVPSHNPSS